jgi:WD40 repeat protein
MNSQTLVSGSGDGTIKLWNWSTGECLSTIQATSSYIYSLAVMNINQQQQTTTSTPTSTLTVPSTTSNVLLIKSNLPNPYDRN